MCVRQKLVKYVVAASIRLERQLLIVPVISPDDGVHAVVDQI